MEDGKAPMSQQQQQQLMQQQLLLQQIQRQKDAISRFPSNIDAHLRPQHHMLHQHRPLNPNSNAQQQIVPNHLHPNSNPNPNPNSAPTSSTSPSTNNPPPPTPPPPQPQPQPQQQQHHKASLQLAYQDAWRVCHPDFKRPFTSLEDACERLLPYHVVADYEAEEDDRILDSATTGQVLSRSQQWDHNIAAKVAEFTATFEKQVLAFNIINRKRGVGEFRTEEKLMMEQLLLQDEKRALMEMRAELDSRQKANRETHEANMRMAAMAQAEQARAESQAHSEMMARGPIRPSARGSNAVGLDMGEHEQEQDQDFQQDDMINGWGNNAQKDDKVPSEDFLNDDETENGDAAMQGEWPAGGELDLNSR